MLNTTTKTVKEVDYNDLDKAITDFLKSKNFTNKNFDKYGYECIAENEWSNYQSHSFPVEPELPDKFELKELKEGELPSTSCLLNWMCADGLIEKGEYLVDIFW